MVAASFAASSLLRVPPSCSGGCIAKRRDARAGPARAAVPAATGLRAAAARFGGVRVTLGADRTRYRASQQAGGRVRCDASAPGPSEGRPNALWRVLACLPYLVPFMGSLAFGMDMFDLYPSISFLITVFGPLLQAYYSNNFTPFFVFFAMFLLVVRNEKLPHFVRFNAMQSILLDICIMLGGLIIQYLPFELSLSWFGTMSNALVFTTGTCAVWYSVFYTLQGKYADIPTVSEAVYIQVR